MDNNSELVTTKRKIIKSSQSLSNLAKQLQSERDRQRYIKVIEMSQTIQSKLQHLHIKNGDSTIAVGRTKQQQKYRHSIIRPIEDSDNEDDKEYEYLDDDDSILFYDDKKKYNTYSGRSFRTLDKKTSIQFLQPSSQLYHKRTSADTIWVDLCMDQGDKKNQIIYMKPKKRQSSSSTTTNIKQIWNMNKVTSIPPTPSPSPSPDIKMEESESEEDEEEEGNPRTIHIAVRRDASLFTIEKTPKPSNQKIHNRKSIYSPPTLPEATIPVAPKRPQSNHDEVVSQRDIPSLVNNDQNAFLSAGLLTPPHSPQGNIQPLAMRFDDDENDDDFMHSYPSIIHVQKKAHQSLKGFITRSYQLNHLTVTKTSSTSSGLFFKAVDNQTKCIKYLLKVLIKSLSNNETERQKRFGFSFLWQKPFLVEETVRQYDDAKFALAPDSLVKEALMTWISFLKQEGGYDEEVPCLLKADTILRDGRKLYVVYDSSLFSM